MPISFTAVAIASAALIAVCALFRHPTNRWVDLNIAAAFVFYPVLLSNAMVLCESIRHRPVDSFLLRADRSIGLDPFLWIHTVWAHHWLFVSMAAIYVALPLFIAFGWVLERSLTMLRAVSLAPLLALIIYNLVPGVGPIHAFADTSGTLLPLDALAHLPRNAFPSMHLSWALLVALNARNKWWKLVAWAFAGLTCAATIGSGEHYYVDLLAAVPFCLAVQYAVSSSILVATLRRSGAKWSVE
jgi:hypothetical protein